MSVPSSAYVRLHEAGVCSDGFCYTLGMTTLVVLIIGLVLAIPVMLMYYGLQWLFPDPVQPPVIKKTIDDQDFEGW